MWVAGWVGIALGTLSVQGNSTCPTPREVEERLLALGVSAPDGAVQQATVDAAAGAVRVRLVEGTGEVVGEHLLPAASCTELVAAAAALISAWEARLRATDAVAPAPAPAPAQPEPPIPDVESEATPKPKPPRRARWEVGLGGTAAVDAVGLTFGGQLQLSYTPGGRGFGADLSLAALGVRDIVVDSVIIDYQRFPLGVGAHYRLLETPVRVDLLAQGALALLLLHSNASPNALTYRSGDVEVSAGVRAQAPLGALLVWFSASGGVWLQQQTLAVVGSTVQRDVPQFEFLFVEGLAFGR